MREKLNENPVYQAAILGLLVIAVGFFFYTRILSSGGAAEDPTPLTETPTAAPATPTPADGAGAADAGATGAAAAAGSGAPPSGIEPGSAPVPGADDTIAAAAAAGAFVPGPGLPVDVVKAYADGKAIVLLVTRGQGIDDRRVKKQVETLRSRGDVAVFITHAKQIAEYSRITNGVEVDRTPALVVVRPRPRSEQGVPQAFVQYGFRRGQSISQAVRDAFYRGREDRPYHPNDGRRRPGRDQS